MAIGCTAFRTMGMAAGAAAGAVAGTQPAAPAPAPMPSRPTTPAALAAAAKGKTWIEFVGPFGSYYPGVPLKTLQDAWYQTNYGPKPIAAPATSGATVDAYNRVTYGTDVPSEIAQVQAYRSANPRYPHAMWPAIAPCPSGFIRVPNAALEDALASGLGTPNHPLPAGAACRPAPPPSPIPGLTTALVQAAAQDHAHVTSATNVGTAASVQPASAPAEAQGLVSRILESAGADVESVTGFGGGSQAATETEDVESAGGGDASLAVAEQEAASQVGATVANVAQAVKTSKLLGAAALGLAALVTTAIVARVVIR